jgi:hypothetical protein
MGNVPPTRPDWAEIAGPVRVQAVEITPVRDSADGFGVRAWEVEDPTVGDRPIVHETVDTWSVCDSIGRGPTGPRSVGPANTSIRQNCVLSVQIDPDGEGGVQRTAYLWTPE